MKNLYKRPSLLARMSTFAAMVKKELLILARYPVEFFASFGQVFVVVTVFTLAGLTFSDTGSGNSAIAGIVGYGFVLYIFLNDTMWTVGFHIRREQVQGTLEQLYLSPASKFASLVARVIHLLVVTSLLSLLSLWIMSRLIGEMPMHNIVGGIFILLFNLSGTFGLGFAFAALTMWLRQTAEVLLNLFQFAFIILGAVFFPFSGLPKVLQAVSKALPFSYGVDLFRSTMMDFPSGFPELAPVEIEALIVLIYGAIMPFIGYRLYRRAEQRARKNGTLSQY